MGRARVWILASDHAERGSAILKHGCSDARSWCTRASSRVFLPLGRGGATDDAGCAVFGVTPAEPSAQPSKLQEIMS